MICKECGEKIEKLTRICPHCGERALIDDELETWNFIADTADKHRREIPAEIPLNEPVPIPDERTAQIDGLERLKDYFVQHSNLYKIVEDLDYIESGLHRPSFVLWLLVGGLIAAFVTAEVTRFNARAEGGETVLRYLTSEEIADAATVGKIGFGADYNGQVQDLTAAIENARQSFEDGIYRIFINGEEAGETCDTPVTLRENDEITFVRLTMLAGRMW